MATSRSTKRNRQFKIDATRPFYAAVGAGDLAVAYARSTAHEVQGRVGRLQDVELEPKALRDQAVAAVEARVNELSKNYTELASRGESFVARVRRQEATKQTQAAAQSTTTKAKTTKTQAKKSAKTASSSAKATGTSAKKTASAAKKATGDAASKAGN